MHNFHFKFLFLAHGKQTSLHLSPRLYDNKFSCERSSHRTHRIAASHVLHRKRRIVFTLFVGLGPAANWNFGHTKNWSLFLVLGWNCSCVMKIINELRDQLSFLILILDTTRVNDGTDGESNQIKLDDVLN